nr:ATP-binding protein [Chloroflexota bacterium]
PGDTLAERRLRIDEHVLHYLTGIEYLDERLSGIVEAVSPPDHLSPSHQRLAETITSAWGREQNAVPAPGIDLFGDDGVAQRAVAAAACAALGIRLCAMHVEEIPAIADVREELARLWGREAILSRSALLVDWGGSTSGKDAQPARRFVQRLHGLVLTAGRVSRSAGRTAIQLEVRAPSSSEQQTVWRDALGPRATALNGTLDMLPAQFHLDSRAVSTVSAAVMPQSQHLSNNELTTRLWDACRAQARVRLDDLAQRIEPAADWADLVLPAAQSETLREVAMHVRRRSTVYGTWGFSEKGARGLGISALFAGPSGTGKTMAAEVLAGELRLDLYRIDLSSVVSKYIGETEKNLRRVFDAAEEGGAILLFDEADALFGKRSEVKDSHDRYANIEVSYLLQRMEAYCGLAVLTTNAKRDLDTAFLRRLRFVVQFPFPDAALRAEIWRRVFPTRTPTEGLDFSTLARLNVPGGAIRNIALHAAFLAADSGAPVGMAHVLRAARTEYAKLEKPLAEIATGGWT